MEELYHHGILGMKWGVRRYQNPDGTLTELGSKRYSRQSNKFSRLEKQLTKKEYRLNKQQHKFQDTIKRATLSDFSYEAKRTQSAKLSKAYRSYIKTGKKFVRNYEQMLKRYGFNNMSSYEVTKGREYTQRYLKNIGTI